MEDEIEYDTEEYLEEDDDGIIEITPDINSDYDEFTEDDILPCTYEEESDNLKGAAQINGNGSPTCTICNKSFSGRKHLYRHIRTVHERATLTTCEICGRKLSDVDSCKRHMINVHKILVPNLSTISRSNLEAEIAAPDTPPSKRIALTPSSLQTTSIKDNTKTSLIDFPSLKGILPSQPVPIQDLKREGYGTELNLPNSPPTSPPSSSPSLMSSSPPPHEPLVTIEQGSLSTLAVDPTAQVFECPDCEDAFKTKTALNFHRLKVHVMKGEPVKCTICSEDYHDLVEHMAQDHVGEYRGTICPACGNGFSKRCTLNRHIEQVHLNIQIHKPATCPICEKVFSKKGHLDRHIKIIHNGIKDYSDPCPYCGKVFTTRASLEPHIAMVHDGVRRKCEICNKELSDLNKHMRTVHGEYRRKSKITPLTPSPSKPTTIASSQQISPTSFGKPAIAAAMSSMADVKTIPSIHDVSSLSLNKVIRQLNTEDLARQLSMQQQISSYSPVPVPQPDIAETLKKELGLGSVITLKRITKPSPAATTTNSTIAAIATATPNMLPPKLSYHGPPIGSAAGSLPNGVPSKFMMPLSVGTISLTPLNKSQ